MADYSLFQGLMQLEDRATQRKYQKKEQEFQETVQKPYMQALTNYQDALATNAADQTIRDLDRQIKANEVVLGKQKAGQLKMQSKLWRENLNSDDPNVVNITRNAILGIQQSNDMNDFIKQMGLQIDYSNMVINTLTAQSKLQADELGKQGYLLQILSDPASLKVLSESQRANLESSAYEKIFGLPEGSGTRTVQTEGVLSNLYETLVDNPSRYLFGGEVQVPGEEQAQPNPTVTDPNLEATLQQLR